MTVIKVDNLSKLYYLKEAPSGSLRDAIAGLFSPTKSNANRELWALKDVNFSIESGETLGIIGRNGAGKSTLLRILSRISKPTRGSVEIRGRVSSLLEVGTGFHTELSGRENVYLNGAVLGMRRTEINKKFDEIVAFSEIERFLDTPVKHYSSGMYMRLAFSIAAHLEPEVLIVDEVLAVGDADFQKKCLGKMDDVKKSGRTVIFVSHQMGSVAKICQSAILLEKGNIALQGPTSVVLEHYLNHGMSRSAYYSDCPLSEREMLIQKAIVLNASNNQQSSFRHDEPVSILIRCVAKKWSSRSQLRMVIRTALGTNVFTADADLGSIANTSSALEGVYIIPAKTLRPNNYSVSLELFVPNDRVYEMVDDAFTFSIYDAGTEHAQSEGVDYGVIFPPSKWNFRDGDNVS